MQNTLQLMREICTFPANEEPEPTAADEGVSSFSLKRKKSKDKKSKKKKKKSHNSDVEDDFDDEDSNDQDYC